MKRIIMLIFMISMLLIFGQAPVSEMVVKEEPMLINKSDVVIEKINESLQKSVEDTSLLVGLTSSQIQKAKLIKDETPLNFESSVYLVKYSDLYEIDYSLILAIIETESNFEQFLVGTSQDRGYMQIIPGTEKFLAESHGDEIGISYDTTQIFEPEYNLGLGIIYIAQLIKEHGHDYDKVLTSYNRGPVGLKKYYEANGTYQTTYSKKVLGKVSKYLALNGNI